MFGRGIRLQALFSHSSADHSPVNFFGQASHWESCWKCVILMDCGAAPKAFEVATFRGYCLGLECRRELGHENETPPANARRTPCAGRTVSLRAGKSSQSRRGPFSSDQPPERPAAIPRGQRRFSSAPPWSRGCLIFRNTAPMRRQQISLPFFGPASLFSVSYGK